MPEFPLDPPEEVKPFPLEPATPEPTPFPLGFTEEGEEIRPFEFEEAERLAAMPTLRELGEEATRGSQITAKRFMSLVAPAAKLLPMNDPRFLGYNPTADFSMAPQEIMSGTELAAAQTQLDQEIQELINTPGKSIGGVVTRDVSRFLSAYLPISLVNAMAGGGALTGLFVGGPVADMIAFSPTEERLSNILADLDSPVFNNAVTRYLRARPGDPEEEALLRQSIEGILLGGVTETIARGFVRGYHAVRGIKRKQLAHGVGVTPETEAIPGSSSRAAREALDTLLNDDATTLLSQPFNVKDVKIPFMSPEEAKAEMLTQAYTIRINELDKAGLLTPQDKIAKIEAFRAQALNKFRPTKPTAARGANINKAYAANRDAVRESQRVTYEQVVDRVRQVTTKEIVDRSGNLKRKLLEEGGRLGREAQIGLELTQGASTKAHFHYDSARKIIFDGLNRTDKDALAQVIMLRRLRQIKTYNPDWDAPINAGGPVKRPGRRTSAGDYDEALKLLRKELGEAKYAELMQRGDAYFGEMVRALDVLKEGGVISADEYVKLSRFQYSPIQYLDRLDPEMAKIGEGPKAITIRSSGIKALGSGDEKIILDDPEMFLGQVLARAHSTSFRNKANQALLKIARTQPDNEVVKLKVPKGRGRDFAQVSVMENGERKKFFIARELVNEWNVDPVSIGWLPKVLSLSAFVRPLATGINPEFVLSNFPRDFMYAWLTAGEGTLFSSNMFKGVGQLTIDLVETFQDAIGRKGQFIDYINEGGGMPLLTHQGQFRSLDPIVAKAGPARQAWTEMQQTLGFLNETSEIWMRLAVRNRELKRLQALRPNRPLSAADRERATWEARRYLDFAQGGGSVKRIDQAIPYFNAAVQGFRGVARAAMKNPGVTAVKVTQIMSVYAGLWAANNTMYAEDFAAVPQAIKDTNMIFMTPLTYIDEEGNRRRAYFKVPVDHSVHGLKALTESLMERAINGKFPEETTMRAMRTLTELTPGVSSIPSINAYAALAQNVDFWRDEKIWKGDPTLPPEGEIRVTGNRPTRQLAIDVGVPLGLSPERLQVAARAIFPKSIYTDAVGWSYEFATNGIDPAMLSEFNLEVIRDLPGPRRFMGLTHPSTAFKEDIETAQEEAALGTKAVFDAINLDIEAFRRENKKPGFTNQQERALERAAEAQDAIYQRTARNYVRAAIKIEKIFARSKVAELPGMPDRTTWLRLIRLRPEARASQFFEFWKAAHVDSVNEDPRVRAAGLSKKRMMIEIAKSLPGFNARQSKEFGVILKRLAQQEDIPLPR